MSMDKEDGFERGFVAGWKARGEHEDGLLIEAELAKRQAEEQQSSVSEAARWAQFAARRDAEIRQQNALHTQAEIIQQQQTAQPIGQQQVNQQSWQGATEVQQQDARNEERRRSEAARVVQGEQQIAALKAQTAKHGPQIGQQTPDSGHVACPVCGSTVWIR